MLPRSNRLPSFEIPTVMRYGKRVSGNGVTLIYLKRKMDSGSESGMTTRIAFIVSTKVDKRAVVRNRMRRVMSESVRHIMKTISPSVDGVFIGSRQLIGLTQLQVEVIIQDLLRKLAIL